MILAYAQTNHINHEQQGVVFQRHRDLKVL